MTTLPAMLFVLVLTLPSGDGGPQPQHHLNVPPGFEITERQGPVRIPWAAETYTFSDPPAQVNMMAVLDKVRQREAEGIVEEPPPLKAKGRIPSGISPELAALYRLEALFLPPSDKIQVLDDTLGRIPLDDSRAAKASGAATSFRSFDSINYGTVGNSVPPDTELAVGPNYVIAVVNSGFQIYTTAGVAVTSAIKFQDFMDENTDCDSGLFDPNALYDEEAQRFILGIDANGTDYCMAVAKTADPLGDWYIYSFATDVGGNFFDFPHAGVGQEAIYVGSNQFEPLAGGGYSFDEARLFAMDRDDLHAGGSVAFKSWSLSEQGYAVTPQPAKLHGYLDGTWPDADEPHYVLTVSGNRRNVHVWTVEDPFGSTVLTRQANLNVQTFTGVSAGYPIDAPQVVGTGDELDTGDGRILDFEYRNGYAWTVQTVSCNPGDGSRNCVRWAKIDPAANSIIDAGVFSGSSVDDQYFHPDLAVDSCENLLIGYTRVGPGLYPSTYVAGRASDHTAGEIQFELQQKAGTAVYSAFDGEPLRWGDYSGATVSPSGEELWYFGEWSTSNGGSANWGTHIAAYSFPDTDDDDVPDSCDICEGFDDASDSDSDNVPDGCDACAGFDDAIDEDIDGSPDGCDTCTDTDNDGAGDPGFDANTCATDNCPDDSNADQADADSDDVGDVCDTCTDTDNDGYGNSGYAANTCETDNCPNDSNADQADADNDDTGDVCDTCTDTDNDGFGNSGYAANTCAADNCPDTSNADQADADGDGTGDVCDTCTDTDNDGAGDPGFNANTCETDNCPDDSNADQADADSDGTGDVCDTCTDTDNDGAGDPGFNANTCATDNCPDDSNADQADADSDGTGDVCDTCTDTDNDGAGDPGFNANTCETDNCPDDSNTDQADADSDDVGDVCDTCTDTDNDGAGDPGFDANTCETDNCPDDSNADQADADSDDVGDVCDTCTDTDNDGYGNSGYAANTCATDNCPDDSNADQLDTDLDDIGDVCDTCTDTDNDGYGNSGYAANTCATDNCPNVTNADQLDTDLDGAGDVCDTCTDTDNDGYGNSGYAANTCAADNCPVIANADQLDADLDGAGDVCDTCTDTDGDGYGNSGYATNICATDNCPDDANADQLDTDNDGIGDACDLCFGDNATGDSDGDGVCADNDCDDNDGNAQEIDRCGVCGGGNVTCADVFEDGFESGGTGSWTVTVL